MNKLSCIGIIMDGNRRFAHERGLPVLEGHRRGLAKVKELLAWVKQGDIKTVFLYAFSIENWQRSKIEVSTLMVLFRKFLKTEVKTLLQHDTRLVCIGELGRFSRGLKKLIDEATIATKKCRTATLVVALSYGGRAEIAAGAKIFAEKYRTKFKTAGEKEFSQCLWTAGLPDPDLIIRTGGEQRLSNFLPWQSVYSELYFTKTYWPALTQSEFEAIIADYRARQRRFGR
ncbi:MAG: di-trans,poly-cis-decaprenylcistransferase [Candidatus Vogelbacteria bacterium]|nr:di-trans,poly-cis-decaprenylcistransferase [Candidatus Vogelbacteria bacterium]